MITLRAQEIVSGPLYPLGFQVLLGLQDLELQWDHTTLHLTIQDHLVQLLSKY